jgi:hypothetical protein
MGLLLHKRTTLFEHLGRAKAFPDPTVHVAEVSASRFDHISPEENSSHAKGIDGLEAVRDGLNMKAKRNVVGLEVLLVVT